MARRHTRPWSPKDEAELLLTTTLKKRGACVDFAKARGRTVRSVRMKLHRLLEDPANRPPTFEAALATYRAAPSDNPARGGATDDLRAPARDPNAAAPRVSPARGPGDTSDRSD